MKKEEIFEDLEDMEVVSVCEEQSDDAIQTETPDLKKFKSPEELLKAYENLEIAFTKKSQELSEAKKQEKEVVEVEKIVEVEVEPNEEKINEIIKNYLETHLKSSPVLMSKSFGGMVAPSGKYEPKTLKDAREYAEKMFK